jgi:cation diffusion facilitator CzcD-associated flavoprotein CzcO
LGYERVFLKLAAARVGHGTGICHKRTSTNALHGLTSYRNRYPGARFDSESYSYNFSFSQEILDEWSWTEHFAPQTETLKYAQFVTDKLSLRGDMQFDTRVSSAHWDESSRTWTLIDQNNSRYVSRFLITAMGILNQPTYPNIPGVHDFTRDAFHTARWPSDVSLSGRRVGIIGTGATGIQTIQEIAKDVGHLTVFQRTPNWSVPLRNTKITPEEMAAIRKDYPAIFKACDDSYACFIHLPDSRKTFDVSAETREAFWEDLYSKPGFAKWMSNFSDIGYDQAANDAYSAWVANKVRSRVRDPTTAEKLIPKNHGFGTRRVPLETNYFEAYNQDNVRLLDVNEDPIQRITATGVQTRDEHVELDVLIYATGFDAVTGAFYAVDFKGVNNATLPAAWADGPRTQLGLLVKDFPNMMMVMGPHQMFGNIPRSIEFAVGWIADCIGWCAKNGVGRIEATELGVENWTAHVHDCAQGRLANEVDSWMTGVNKNLAHKQKRIVARYNGPAPGYRKRAREAADAGYRDFSLS